MRIAARLVGIVSLWVAMACGGGEEGAAESEVRERATVTPPPTAARGSMLPQSPAAPIQPPATPATAPPTSTPPVQPASMTPRAGMTPPPPPPPPGPPATPPAAGAPPVTMGGAAGAPPPPPPTMPAAGGAMPKIPEVKGECPPFRDSTITFGGVSGIQMVAGPKAASATAPMVFYWHGTGSFAGEFLGSAAAVHQGVGAEGGVLISFQGSSGMGDASCSGTFIFALGDMDIADQLLACAVKNHNVDPRRVFSTGCSAGGLFATCMAARRSSYLAAAAPNSGGFTFPQPFENMYTPALMTMHGAAGRDVVGVDFSVSSATADAAFKQRGGFVINCDTGGGHCGAGGLSGEVWQFFKAHPYGVQPFPWKDGLPAGFSSKCKIY